MLAGGGCSCLPVHHFVMLALPGRSSTCRHCLDDTHCDTAFKCGSDGNCQARCASNLAYCPLTDSCVDTNSDDANCGSCGTECSTLYGTKPHVASVACGSGSCQLTCQPGYSDCDGAASTGCEADLASVATCGSCGLACSGYTPHCW